MTDDRPDLPGGGPDPIDPAITSALSSLPEGFSHFARIFQDEIRPALQAREGDRIAAVAKARQARQLSGSAMSGGVRAMSQSSARKQRPCWSRLSRVNSN